MPAVRVPGCVREQAFDHRPCALGFAEFEEGAGVADAVLAKVRFLERAFEEFDRADPFLARHVLSAEAGQDATALEVAFAGVGLGDDVGGVLGHRLIAQGERPVVPRQRFVEAPEAHQHAPFVVVATAR